MSRPTHEAVKRGRRERRGKGRAKGKRMGREKERERRRRQVVRMEERAEGALLLEHSERTI